MKRDSAIIVHRAPGHKSEHGTLQSTRLTNKEHQDNDNNQSNNGYRHSPYCWTQTILLAGLFASAGGDWIRGSGSGNSWGKKDKTCQNIRRVILRLELGRRGDQWLVRWTPDRAVWVRALTKIIVLCSWARHFTLIVPLSTQVYKWVPVNLLLGDNPAMD